jgi:hypothetical protein
MALELRGAALLPPTRDAAAPRRLNDPDQRLGGRQADDARVQLVDPAGQYAQNIRRWMCSAEQIARCECAH